MEKFTYHPSPQITYWGLSENDDFYCLVRSPHCGGNIDPIIQPKSVEVAEWLDEMRDENRHNIMRCVPFDYVWRNYFTLPCRSHAEMHREIVEIIKRELPIPIDDVIFDYSYQNSYDNRHYHVAVYAIRKNLADELQCLPSMTLGCQFFAMFRAYRYFIPGSCWHERVICQNRQMTLTLNGLITEPIPEGETYPFNVPYPEVDPQLYLSALGSSLWTSKEYGFPIH